MAIRQNLDKTLVRIETMFMWVAVIALIMAGILVLLAVLARQFPVLQIPDSYLFVKFLMLTAIALGLGQATGQGHHISVDLIYAQFSPRMKSVARYVAVIAGLIFFIPLSWWYGGIAIEMFERGRTQPGLLRLPRWPLYVIMSAGFSLVSLRLALMLLTGDTDRGQEAPKER